MKPLVSVIIPNYNYAEYLPRRMESVLGQTYGNMELIILDDCSTDGSRDVIEAYRDCPKVRHVVFNEENSRSAFKQWKRGIDLARGDFVWIAECDDYADERFLEKIMAHMAGDASLKIGFSGSYWVAPERTFVNEDYTIPDPVRVYAGREFVRRHLLKENFIYNASMAVFRRDALEAEDMEEASTFRSCGDKLLWSRLAEKGKVVFVCSPLNYFRIHAGKVTSASVADGTLFREEHRLFLGNVGNGYVTLGNRYGVASYFARYVRRSRQGMDSEAVYEECLSLWEGERNFRNRNLPLSYRAVCLVKGLFCRC